METNELLTSLARLESTLQEVESAKNQVKQTVDAYDILQKQIKEYTQSLDSIKTSIRGILSDINSQRTSLGQEAMGITASLESKCNQLLKTLKTDLAAANETFAKEGKIISDSFKKSTDYELANLKTTVQSLKECTTALQALSESIKNTLSKINQLRQEIAELKQSLESSQGAQDALLSEINTCINSLSDELGSFKTAQDNAFKKVDAQFKANSEKMDNLARGLDKRQRLLFIVALVNTVLIIALGVLFCLK